MVTNAKPVEKISARIRLSFAEEPIVVSSANSSPKKAAHISTVTTRENCKSCGVQICRMNSSNTTAQSMNSHAGMLIFSIHVLNRFKRIPRFYVV